MSVKRGPPYLTVSARAAGIVGAHPQAQALDAALAVVMEPHQMQEEAGDVA